MSASRSLVVEGFVRTAVAALIAVGGPAVAAERGASSPPTREEAPAWLELKSPQQAILAPLRQEWPQLETRSKRRWIELAARFPTLGPDEQARVQARMAQWAHMTPTQRNEARLNYQEAKQLAPGDRKARWDAYQALPPEQKRELAGRSMVQASRPADLLPRSGPRADRSRLDSASAAGAPALPAPRAIAPALLQATPGASTTLIDRRPTPPEHQRPGTRSGIPTPQHSLPAARHEGPAAASSPSAAAEPGSVPAALERPIPDTTPTLR